MIARFAQVAAFFCIVLLGAIAIAQPQPQPRPLPQPGQVPSVPPRRPLPGELQGQPGQLPPGHPQVGRPRPRPPEPAPAAPAKAHQEHCPGHGPTDAVHWSDINWWQGLIGVSNETAGKENASFFDKLLWRYENPNDPCDEKNKPAPFAASVINFSLLAFLLVRFGKKPIAEALVKRKESIMLEIDTAARLRKEARGRLKEYQEKFDTIDETLESLKAEYVTQSEQEKKRILAEAQERKERMRRDAELRIEQERKAARLELLQQAAEQAAITAETLLKTRVAATDQDRLAEDYLAGLGTAVRDSGSASLGERA